MLFSLLKQVYLVKLFHVKKYYFQLNHNVKYDVWFDAYKWSVFC